MVVFMDLDIRLIGLFLVLIVLLFMPVFLGWLFIIGVNTLLRWRKSETILLGFWLIFSCGLLFSLPIYYWLYLSMK